MERLYRKPITVRVRLALEMLKNSPTTMQIFFRTSVKRGGEALRKPQTDSGKYQQFLLAKALGQKPRLALDLRLNSLTATAIFNICQGRPHDLPLKRGGDAKCPMQSPIVSHGESPAHKPQFLLCKFFKTHQSCSNVDLKHFPVKTLEPPLKW